MDLLGNTPADPALAQTPALDVQYGDDDIQTQNLTKSAVPSPVDTHSLEDDFELLNIFAVLSSKP
ncbi:hypothetical protein RRF57_001334 [Xylaria bambusicola]|uniref:Uncharacterized protein n=1 Tax=Xylaria bambusicola TaxID=326684 RepID=A0AAN7UBQ3_9PEZI